MKHWIGIALLCISTLVAAEAVPQKDPQVAWGHIEQGALVVDVRTAEEFEVGHLNNAAHVPFEQIGEWAQAQNIAKDQSIVLYCRSGRRSGIATETLMSMGYTNVYNGGGLESLQTHQQP
ncbi:rhodanese-like domain-containing protein [Paraferrimonas sedimenticola]|uniref:Sulfurtransferase n=1 Tax=Paraferrimonas sedimenticola TaxID=375674 RepID=A0AA37RVS5_9GAMM|nr:rhodanese-like domain-containing protein [Paraferrimonas sedimenticola]GLP96605.1 sulfurtransferase [Paraferrimonas sedimenticola]